MEGSAERVDLGVEGLLIASKVVLATHPPRALVHWVVGAPVLAAAQDGGVCSSSRHIATAPTDSGPYYNWLCPLGQDKG